MIGARRNRMKEFDGWEKERRLGSGGEGDVFLARRVKSGEPLINRQRTLMALIRKAGAMVANEEQFKALAPALWQAVYEAGNPGEVFEWGALKVLKAVNKTTDERVDREIEAMASFSAHPNCLRLIHTPGKPRLWFVTEVHPRGG
jgi:serine/threonine protein kinase